MDVLEKLRQELPNLPKKLAKAARYALDAPDQIALNSMRSSAAQVGVTSTTMLRLSRRLGFAGYEEFRAQFQKQLVKTGFGARAGALHSTGHTKEALALAKLMLSACHQGLSETLDAENLAGLSHVASLMRNAPTVYLIGSGSMSLLTNMMITTGSMIMPNLKLVGTEFTVAAEGMVHVSPKDVVICFGVNPCATRTLDAMTFAKTKGAVTIAMTDRPSSPLAAHATHCFYASTQSPHYHPSIVSLVALVETLLATIVAEGGKAELDRIEEFEKRRNTRSAYSEYDP